MSYWLNKIVEDQLKCYMNVLLKTVKKTVKCYIQYKDDGALKKSILKAISYHMLQLIEYLKHLN